MNTREPHHIPDGFLYPADAGIPLAGAGQELPRSAARSARQESDRSELGLLEGLSLVHRFEREGSLPLWLVEFDRQKQEALDLPSGPYSLMLLASGQQERLALASRLCSLEEHPNLATLEALSQYGEHHHLWLRQLGGGTLADLLAARGRLEVAEVSWLAQELAEGLDFCHRHDFSFSALGVADCAFTQQPRAVLLVPDLDNRGLGEARVLERRALDRRNFARLLWFCLLGEMAPVQSQRLPLNLLVPGLSASTAALFEEALDGAKPPEAYELALALAQDARPLIPPLHLSAPPATRGHLPPLPQAVTREQGFVPQKQKGKGTGTGFFSRSAASSPRKTGGRPGLSGKQKKLALGLGALALLGLGGFGYLLTQQTPAPQEQLAAVEATAEAGGPTSGFDVGQLSDLGGGKISQFSAGEEAEQEQMRQVLEEALQQRNRALSSGDRQLVGLYALPQSSLYRQDMETLVRIQQAEPVTYSLSLAEVHLAQMEGESYRVVATVKAEGLTTQQDLGPGVFEKDGIPHQKVEFIFQKVEGRWLLAQAQPTGAEDSSP